MSLPARGRVGDMGVGIACAKALRRERAWYFVGIKEDRMAEGTYSWTGEMGGGQIREGSVDPITGFQ